MKFKAYKEGDLIGDLLLTKKIDGVRARFTPQGAVSRANKPLYNLSQFKLSGEYEVYRTNWETSVSLVKTQSPTDITLDDLYSLDPVDSRLVVGDYPILTEKDIKDALKEALKNNYEGLVIFDRSTNIHWKVKPIETYDVVVTGVQPGTGKHAGRLGAALTNKGKVGTGFSDLDRETFWKDPTFIGSVIECSCMQLTKNGKMRHARFLRRRFDKTNETSNS